MTRDEILAVVEDHERMLSAHDVDGLTAQYAERAVVESPMFGVLTGRAAVEGSFRSLFAAFPDWESRREDLVIDRERAVAVFRTSATRTKELAGLPGTGKRFEIRTVLVWTFQDGAIVHERRIYDFTGVLVQTGVLKARPA